MAVLYVLTMLFFILPIVVALLEKAGIKYGFISPPPYSRLTSKAKTMGAEGCFTSAVLTSVTTLIVLAGYGLVTGGKIPILAGGIVMAVIVASTLALGVITLRATSIYQLSPKAFNLAASSVALLVVLVASIYADAHITQSIGVKGSDLPSAFRVLTILLAAYWWTIVFTIASLFLYIITLLLWAGHSFSSTDQELQRRSFVMLGKGSIRKNSSKEFVYFTLFIGFAFTALIPINTLAFFERDQRLVRFANELIVFSVFHLTKNDCYPDAPKGAYFALVDSGRIAAATPDEKVGFKYQLKACKTL